MRFAFWVGGVPLVFALFVYFVLGPIGHHLSQANQQALGEVIGQLIVLFYGAGAALVLLVFLPVIILGAASAIFGWGPVFLGLWFSGGRRRRW